MGKDSEEILLLICDVLDSYRRRCRYFLDVVQSSEDQSLYREGTEHFLKGQIKGFESALFVVKSEMKILGKEREHDI